MTRSSRIIIIFVVIALMLGIGCLFFVDFSGGAQNLQNAQKLSLIHIQMCIRDRVKKSLAGETLTEEELKQYRTMCMPVSYTHLDVYKRQTLDFVWE